MEKYIKCRRCSCLKIADEFGIKKDGDIYKTCINCRESDKKYRLENPEKTKKNAKKYRLENPDKKKENGKNWYLKNPDYYKKYRQDIKLNNPLRHLAILQRNQLSRCLKLTDLTKRGHSIEYLDCDVEYFYNFLKNKMDIWNNANPTNLMTFENTHLDHIKPISVFNFDCEDAESNFLDCCNYTNIQPLLIKDNLSKSNKWTDENDAYWNDNIKGNAEYCDIYLT